MKTEKIEEVLYRIVSVRVGTEAGWFNNQCAELKSSDVESDLHLYLGFVPRKLGKADLDPTPDEAAAVKDAYDGWSVDNWSIDVAARIYGLLVFKPQRPFADMFKDLRRTSDAAEMIALYCGLALYPKPQSLAFEVGEGLRSNLRPVFEAICHHNPYPRDHFDEHRWNHMILKALFVGSELSPILGLRERANRELARILVDYAAERHAAGRPITEELWIPIEPFHTDPEIAALLDRLGDAAPSF
ncbi:EboA domain-containing protein [uncultured Roseobacter sp.]|uniref:EboA domain-containing protein n=1 Tax=uncultured Roseobacter sp. TaxID=114847 RepID=UPI002621F4F1|nr:EboA domain-containing protein [uncultured Roseobacter sp.]